MSDMVIDTVIIWVTNWHNEAESLWMNQWESNIVFYSRIVCELSNICSVDKIPA
jgi:hypothetical protein